MTEVRPSSPPAVWNIAEDPLGTRVRMTSNHDRSWLTIETAKDQEVMRVPLDAAMADLLWRARQGEALPDVPMEHERKFLVINDDWREQAIVQHVLHQMYVARDVSGWQVRLRCNETTHQAHLTIKGPRVGASNVEIEPTVPIIIAQQCWSRLPGPRLVKRRFKIPAPEGIWEVDEFLSPGLVGETVAEIELESPHQTFHRPDWLGSEVTTDPAYRNDRLAARSGELCPTIEDSHVEPLVLSIHGKTTRPS